MTSPYKNESFRRFIYDLLTLSNLKKTYLEKLTTPENMEIYESVVTHISIDPAKNYEFYEILGDVTLNKSIVWYIKERFPFLQNAEGVKIIARLRINLVSKKHFSRISRNIGFLPFIRAEEETMATQETSILEDVFEAFFGATEFMIDKMICPGAGYGVCYQLIKTLLDMEDISLRYEDLYDPITRLKETFDYYRSSLPGRECPLIWGTMKFENLKNENEQVVRLYQINPQHHGIRKLLITTSAPLLDEAKQNACEQYLRFLEKSGYKRPIPDYYATIAKKM
jgi:dsRNA-specific ribonuclease